MQWELLTFHLDPDISALRKHPLFINNVDKKRESTN